MNEDRNRVTVLDILRAIMATVALLLYLLQQYFHASDADYFYFVPFYFDFVLPVTLVLEIIRWFKNKT